MRARSLSDLHRHRSCMQSTYATSAGSGAQQDSQGDLRRASLHGLVRERLTQAAAALRAELTAIGQELLAKPDMVRGVGLP